MTRRGPMWTAAPALWLGALGIAAEEAVVIEQTVDEIEALFTSLLTSICCCMLDVSDTRRVHS